jgi:hypothetical protein
MPKHTPHSEHINPAVGIMKSHPTLTAAMAMQLAGFSEEDYSKYNRTRQRMKRNLTTPWKEKWIASWTLPMLFNVVI